MSRRHQHAFLDSDSDGDDIPLPSAFSQESEAVSSFAPRRLAILEISSSSSSSSHNSCCSSDIEEVSGPSVKHEKRLDSVANAFHKLVLSPDSIPSVESDDEDYILSEDDGSVQIDDDSTVVQEGRVKTPKRKVIVDHDDESLTDGSYAASIENEDINHDQYPNPNLSARLQSLTSKNKSPFDSDMVGGKDKMVELSANGLSTTPTIDSPERGQQTTNLSNSKKVSTCDGGIGDSAWSHDTATDEFFLSSNEHKLPRVTWPKMRIPSELYKNLYSHQKIGVQWMASLHNNGVGGILGDDMGMGKTYQALSYLGGLMRTGVIRNALVVAPLSVLRSWEKEAHAVMRQNCVPKVTIEVVSSAVRKTLRCRIVQDALSCTPQYPYLVITTYGLVGSNPMDFVSDCDDWDYVVLDEGHKIKNPSAAISKGCRRICKSKHTRRLMLTGTPIQNNLKELWALFDWATSGNILGKLPRFVNQYAKPIEDGRNKNASAPTMRIAEKANSELQQVLRPHFLQRMKTDFLSQLPAKRELVVWTHLSSKQRKLYEKYVESGDKVASVLSGDLKSPLEAVTWLKKLCGHPLLVETSSHDVNRADAITKKNPDELIRESAKLEVLVALLERLQTSGHRTLIFSQSTRMLDIIERVLQKTPLSRIDGSTSEKHRQRRVEEFNERDSNIKVMLLSTKAAGIGLTLTGADRAIIYDPSWNPAEDSQAVDRCYRIGQTKDVTVYRLIAAGTVEEKMYEKQVHKDGIRRAVTTNVGSATERFFDQKDLRKLFQLAPAGECAVLATLQAENHVPPLGSSGKPTFLGSQLGVVGVSSHDGIYSRSTIDLTSEVGGETPFGGTPAKTNFVGRSQRALMSRRDDNVQVTDNAAKVPDNATKGSFQKCVNLVDDDIENQRPNRLSTKAAPERVGLSPKLPNVPSLLSIAETLLEEGKTHEAVKSLLDMLETTDLRGSEKIRLHRHLAHLGRELGWLV